MNKSNVLEFPKSKIVRDVTPELDEQIAKKKEKSRLNYAEAMTEDMTAGLYAELENCGIDTTEPAFMKDFAFLAGVMKATVYRNMGLEHPFHSMIDKSVHIRTLPIDASEEDIAKLLAEMAAQYGNVEELAEDSVLKEIIEKSEEDTQE